MSEKNIRFIRMINGDDVIAEVQEGERVTRIIKPIQVILNKQLVKPEIVMVAWLPVSSSDADDVDVKNDHILFSVPLTPKVAARLAAYMDQIYTPAHTEAAAGEDTPIVTEESQKTLGQIEDILKTFKGKKPN